MHEKRSKRAGGGGSWSMQHMRMDAAEGGGGGSALAELEPPTEKADAMKTLGQIVERVNVLSKRGGVSKEEMETLSKGVKDLAAQMKSVDDIVQQNLRSLEGRTDRTISLKAFAGRAKAPKGMSSEYYGLMTLAPEDMTFVSHLAPEHRTGALGMAMTRFGRGLEPNDERSLLIRELQQVNDDLYFDDLLRMHVNDGAYAGIGNSRKKRMETLPLWPRWKELAEDCARAGMDTATAGEGTEWVPTVLSNRLIELIQTELRVVPLFMSMPMPAKNFDLPVVASDPIAYFVGEETGEAAGAGIPTTTPGTGKVSLVSKKLATRIFTSNEFLEDSIVPATPFISARAAKAIARGREDAVINGDTAVTHQDSDVTAATDRRKIWNGLRKKALISGMPNVDLATFSTANLLAIKKSMGVYGSMPSQGVWIVGFKGFIKLLDLAAGATAGNEVLLTVDKLGPQATILTGQVAQLFGSPVVLSEFIREDLTANAVFDGVTTTETHLLYVNREAFLNGDRRGVQVKFSDTRHIEHDQTVYVSTWRGDFVELYNTAAAANKIVGIGRNFN